MFGKKPPTVEALGSRKLVAFVPALDPVRAKAFYGKVLNLRLLNEDTFALVFDAAGTTLRISIVPEMTPAPHTVLGWLVPDIQQAVTELTQRSVQFERFDGMDQDSLGIWTSASGAKVAWFRDPDGNVLSITQT